MTRRAAALALLSVIGLGCDDAARRSVRRATARATGAARSRSGAPRRRTTAITRRIQRRIAEVEAEFAELVQGYKQSARSSSSRDAWRRRCSTTASRWRSSPTTPRSSDTCSSSRAQLAALKTRSRPSTASSSRRRQSEGRLVADRRAAPPRSASIPISRRQQRQLDAALARDWPRARRSSRASTRSCWRAGDLQAAQTTLDALRKLEPRDPQLENEQRRLTASIALEWRRQQRSRRRSVHRSRSAPARSRA